MNFTSLHRVAFGCHVNCTSRIPSTCRLCRLNWSSSFSTDMMKWADVIASKICCRAVGIKSLKYQERYFELHVLEPHTMEMTCLSERNRSNNSERQTINKFKGHLKRYHFRSRIMQLNQHWKNLKTSVKRESYEDLKIM